MANCPPPNYPPDPALDALAIAGRNDPATAEWVQDLDRHYQKLETCS